MQNPFETGHIKNYLLLYASVVVIMILFFIAATLFRDAEMIETKVFETQAKEQTTKGVVVEVPKEEKKETRFKLLDKAY